MGRHWKRFKQRHPKAHKVIKYGAAGVVGGAAVVTGLHFIPAGIAIGATTGAIAGAMGATPLRKRKMSGRRQGVRIATAAGGGVIGGFYPLVGILSLLGIGAGRQIAHPEKRQKWKNRIKKISG